ncbi:hypothetical protein, partial [Cytobacillus sp. IB215665]|uniref:hypothetical protein n=1 Tax=Cytobacillus sp. IB215665 TaxID=3097357 RepID=UPI002A0B28E3
AASVRPEPGSNSPIKFDCSFVLKKLTLTLLFCLVFKEHFLLLSLRGDLINITFLFVCVNNFFSMFFNMMLLLTATDNNISSIRFTVNTFYGEI